MGISPKMVIFKHVAKGRQGLPRSKGDPRVGWDELEPNRSYLSHFPTWYSKLGHFPIEIPIKNENGWYPIVYGSIICFWSVVLSYLSAWAPQATKQNSNFEVKRNTLCPGVLLGTTMHSILMKRTSTCMLKSLRQKTGRVDVVLAKSSKANV